MDNESDGLISSYDNDFDEDEIRKAKAEKYRKKHNIVSSYLILEPAAFLLFYAFNVSGVVLVDQIEFQTCTVTLNFNASDCLMLGKENKTQAIQELQDIVQPYTAKIMMGKSLMEFILPTVFSLFIGPWSDKFGRKPLIFAPFCGYFLTFLLISIISSLSTIYPINPAYYSFAYLPAAFSGGYCTLFTGLFCYITDVTTENNRAIKMGVLEAALYLGLLGGSLSSSHILNATNATTVFTIAAGTIFSGIIYIRVFISESIIVSDLNKRKSRIRELFRFSLVRDMFITCFKKRKNNDRAIIVLIMSILGATIFANQGAGTIFYLFVRSKFEWTIRDINYYDAVNIILLILGNIIGMFIIRKIFNASEIMLAVIAYLSYMLNSSIKAFAAQSWHLYLATFLGLLKGLAEPTCRALISNIAPGSDIGKLFSLTTAIESLAPVAAAPLYAYVYSTTLKTYIGAFNFISTWIYFMCLALLFVVYMFQKAFHNHNMSHNHVSLTSKT